MTQHSETPGPLIIAGMHRSGTSMLANFLSDAGLFIGKKLLAGGEGNEKGYFENVDFFSLHKSALIKLGEDGAGFTLKTFENFPSEIESQVDGIVARNSENLQWGWKDPRTCLFLGYWLKKLPDAKLVCIFRPPWQVADSLYRRGDQIFLDNPELALLTWQHYNQQIISLCRTQPSRCLLIDIDTVTSTPGELIAEINRRFGYKLVAPPSTPFDPSMLLTDNSEHQIFIEQNYPAVFAMWHELQQLAWKPATAVQPQDNRAQDSVARHFEQWLSSRQVHRDLYASKAKVRHLEHVCKTLEEQKLEVWDELSKERSRGHSLENKLQLLGNSSLWRWRNRVARVLGKEVVGVTE